jgi:capsular exopolysaccharide synthesis family protein
MGGAPAPGFAMTPGDVWRVICANAWLIALFLVISSIAGFFAYDYLEKHDSTYTSTGMVRIVPLQSPDPIHPAAPPDLQTMELQKATEIQRFRNESLVDDLLKDLDNPVRTTNWWKVTCEQNPELAHEELSKNLGTDPMPGTELMRISFTAADKSDTPKLVKAIVDLAIQEQREFIRNKYDTDHKRIFELKVKYETELRNTIESEKLKVADITAHGGNPTSPDNVKTMELKVRVEEQIALQSSKIEIDNEVAALHEMKDRGETFPRVQEMVNNDRDILATKDTLDNVAMRIADLNSSGGPNSPAAKAMQHQQDLYLKRLDDLKAEKNAFYSNEYEQQLLASQKTVDEKLDHANAEVSRLESEVADLANKCAAYKSLVEDEAVHRDYVKSYEKGLQDVDQMIRQAETGSLEWFTYPREPNTRSFPKFGSVMLSAVFVGLALSLGIAFLRELTDTTVRSPRDIIRVGQMNLLGMVPHEADDPQSSGARLPLVIFEAPHSIMAEQLRQVRTRLQHAASLDTTRSILVTSPGPGDGKSTICVNIAAGLALNGRRILLVDANFRRPELHRIFGVGNEAGFSDVLNDVNAFAANVRETPVPNLSVMASGPKPSNPTELLESQLLLDFIERALEEYDHVIFDSGPMLFVSESVALAPRVDGVVTVVRARSSSRGVLQRMRDGLRAVKAEHLGIVLNGVRSQAGGYYGRSIKTYYEYQAAE